MFGSIQPVILFLVNTIYGVILWDKTAAVLKNIVCSYCTSGALHNEMKITLQVIL